jgi:hypothetical protein
MKSKIGLAASVLALGGCSSIQNDLGKMGADLSSQPAIVTCWSGGEVIYQTTTTGKVTTGSGDMATFYDENGNLVEMYADCSFVYDVKPTAKPTPSVLPSSIQSSPEGSRAPTSNKRVNPITGR